MSEQTPLDPRVRRTRQLLQDALLVLATEQDFGTITVHDITRRAGVNRATFYMHYRDRDDLLSQTLEDLVGGLSAECTAARDMATPPARDWVPPEIRRVLEKIEERADLYRQLLSPTGSALFPTRLEAQLEQIFLHGGDDRPHSANGIEAPMEVRARCAAAALVGFIDWWLNQEPRGSAEQMARWVWQILGSMATAPDEVPVG